MSLSLRSPFLFWVVGLGRGRPWCFPCRSAPAPFGGRALRPKGGCARPRPNPPCDHASATLGLGAPRLLAWSSLSLSFSLVVAPLRAHRFAFADKLGGVSCGVFAPFGRAAAATQVSLRTTRCGAPLSVAPCEESLHIAASASSSPRLRAREARAPPKKNQPLGLRALRG